MSYKTRERTTPTKKKEKKIHVCPNFSWWGEIPCLLLSSLMFLWRALVQGSESKSPHGATSSAAQPRSGPEHDGEVVALTPGKQTVLVLPCWSHTGTAAASCKYHADNETDGCRAKNEARTVVARSGRASGSPN